MEYELDSTAYFCPYLALLMRYTYEEILAVKQIYWSHVVEANHSCLRLFVALGGLAPLSLPLNMTRELMSAWPQRDRLLRHAEP